MTHQQHDASFDDAIDADAAIAEALARAQVAGRRVAIVFGADWCPDCRAFDAMAQDPLVASVLAHGFELVRIGVGRRDRHVEVAARYAIDLDRGIPAVVVLDGDGSVRAATRAGELRAARTLRATELARLAAAWLVA